MKAWTNAGMSKVQPRLVDGGQERKDASPPCVPGGAEALHTAFSETIASATGIPFTTSPRCHARFWAYDRERIVAFERTVAPEDVVVALSAAGSV